MHCEPSDLFQKLEFDKVLDLLAQECLGDLGKKEAKYLIPGTAHALIERRLNEVMEMKMSAERRDLFPFTSYSDTSDELKLLAVEGYVLSEESIRNISRILKLINNIISFFKGDRRKVYPNLFDLVKDVNFDPDLIKAIDKILDDEGNIRSDASPELMQIRRQMASKMRELDKVFRVIIHNYRGKGWLADNVESFRNGRRVLSVPSEHKRKIRGIIHDESTTGRTAYIEPEEIIDINNDLFDLETDEKKEIYRLLKMLSEMLRPFTPDISLYQKIIVQIDLIQAKVKLALRMDARKPKLYPKPHVRIEQGYHPLLYVKNRELKKITVPYNLYFQGEKRILILSGPNAGGKSITMKAVGLMQLMVQAGMLVPVGKESEMGIFHKIFADIGDQQSIEDDLSTYSSRLKNMETFLRYSNGHSLVLIDEFGSGTDPKIGGAIAEAILRELNFRKVYGVITTHYSNLKVFAFKTKGLINGSMTFDKDSLSPTYQLKVGQPGSSYAFEIAQKSGLSPKVLDYAKHKTGKNEKAVDELLVDLQKDKQILEEKLATIQGKEQKLDQLVQNYENLFKELEFQRKKFKLESKEQALQNVIKENKTFENVIREIKEHQNLTHAKKLSIQVKEKRKKLTEEVEELKEEVYYQPVNKKSNKEPLQEGDNIRFLNGGAYGTIERIEKNKAIVMIGDMRMTVLLKDLEKANAPLEARSQESIVSNLLTRASKFDSKIDIRGLRHEEALKMLEDFVDRALMANSPSLTIIHGKGNGVLRNAVRQKLKEYNVEMDLSHGHPDEGGDGITYVTIK